MDRVRPRSPNCSDGWCRETGLSLVMNGSSFSLSTGPTQPREQSAHPLLHRQHVVNGLVRGDNLASQLLASSHQKIYVTYGAAHLPGVMELMRHEPGWKVASVQRMRTIAPPEHLEGRL